MSSKKTLFRSDYAVKFFNAEGQQLGDETINLLISKIKYNDKNRSVKFHIHENVDRDGIEFISTLASKVTVVKVTSFNGLPLFEKRVSYAGLKTKFRMSSSKPVTLKIDFTFS